QDAGHAAYLGERHGGSRPEGRYQHPLLHLGKRFRSGLPPGFESRGYREGEETGGRRGRQSGRQPAQRSLRKEKIAIAAGNHTGPRKGNFWRSLVAVVIGNAIYFGFESYLPLKARHEPYQVDWGLAVDFWLCLVCYGLIRFIR